MVDSIPIACNMVTRVPCRSIRFSPGPVAATAVMRPISVGILPVHHHRADSYANCMQHSHNGALLVNRLLLRYNISIFVMCPISVGMVPAHHDRPVVDHRSPIARNIVTRVSSKAIIHHKRTGSSDSDVSETTNQPTCQSIGCKLELDDVQAIRTGRYAVQIRQRRRRGRPPSS